MCVLVKLRGLVDKGDCENPFFSILLHECLRLAPYLVFMGYLNTLSAAEGICL